MKTTEKILVLDGHSNQALACVRSLGAAGYEVLVGSHQRFPLGAWSRYSGGTFLLKDQDVAAFAAMRDWARRESVEIVLPLTERSCVLCNAERAKWEDNGITVGCGSDEMLQTAFDKALTLSRAGKAGARIPPTCFPKSLDDCLAAVEEVGFPCVIKQRWSNAWDGSRFLATQSPIYVNSYDRLPEILSAHRQGDHWPLIQGYVPGQGKGVFALCDRGRGIAWFAHERLRDTRPTGSRSSLRRSIHLEKRLREPAEKLLSDLNWHGPAMVEFKDDGIQQPCLMEINGRFWGSLQLAIDAGVDFPRLWVSMLKGEKLQPVGSYVEGLTLRWFWGDVKRLFFILRGAPEGYPNAFPQALQGIKELVGRQPEGTHMEMWRAGDRWPGVGELACGVRELLAWRDTDSPRTNGSHNEVRSPAGANGTSTSSHGVGRESVVIREATNEELMRWDELVTGFDNYRVTHKRAWMHSLENSVKGRPLYLVFERHKKVVACLPGFLTNIGPLRIFGSPLQGWQTVSMGPAFDQNLISSEEMVVQLLGFLEKSYGIHHIELISSALDQQVLEKFHFKSESLPTYRARLFPGDEGRALRAMKDSARRNVKRGIKLGLVVRFEDDESFVDEHYDQLREVFARGGNTIPFGKKRAVEFFRHMKAAGNLIAVSVYLPDGGPNIATGMFTIESKELLLWMWAHRTQYRWYRPTELMTWTVMKKAMELGCETVDFMGRGDFKAKFGAQIDATKHRWVWSRYAWLAATRSLAGRGYKWQQAMRGRMIRRSMFRIAAGSGQQSVSRTSIPSFRSTSNETRRTAIGMSSIRVLMITCEWPAPGKNVTAHFIKRQADFLTAAGVDLDVFPFKGAKNPFNYLKAWWLLRQKLRSENYDLIHAQFGQSGLLALPKRLPLIVTFRGSDLLGTVSDRTGRHLLASVVHQYLSRIVAARANAVIVVSEHMKSHLHQAIEAHVIPSGIDFDVFRPSEKSVARQRLGLPAEEKLVLFVGRPTQARKRCYLAQQAVEILNRSMPAKLIVAWGVPHSDIPLYMSACDALVFTSLQEGSPNVVKEALACNLPVVSVPVGDVAVRLQRIAGCELCEDDAPATIAAALGRVLAREGRIEGREAVRSLDENMTTAKVLNIYQSVLETQEAA